MAAYHDEEWGQPIDDDTELFERLALESFQAGLSWSTILRKRDSFRAAFRGFDPAIVAALTTLTGLDSWRTRGSSATAPRSTPRSATPGHSSNVRGVRRLRAYLASMVPPPPARLPAGAVGGDIPATTPASDALSKDLKRRGFGFVGSTIVYAFMQSVGLVDDHLPGCFRYRG